MNSIKIISQSIVLIDGVFKDQTQGIIQISSDSKSVFDPLFNPFRLQKMMKDLFQEDIEPSSSNMIYKFNDITFQYETFPPFRFTIAHLSDKKSDKIDKIANQLMDDTKLADNIGAVGINYELFIPNPTTNLRDKIVQTKLLTNIEAINCTLQYSIINNMKFTLQIANAKHGVEDGIYFKANYHHNVIAEESVKTILQRNYFDEIKKKINDIAS